MGASRLFGTNGIRFLAEEERVLNLSVKMGLAFGSFLKKGASVFVAMDGRLSSPMIKACVMAGLTATGCSVHDIGLLPTPVAQYAIRRYKPDGGVIISASHNPPEFGGIKTLSSDGVETSREEERVIEQIYFNEKFRKVSWTELGKVYVKPGIIDLYKEAVKSHVDVNAIRSERFHVVVDPGNGAGALVYPSLLSEVGCEVTAINSEVDGTFPGRAPEPRPDELTELSEQVLRLGADLGIAYDGDGDRALFCDEKGVVHWGDKSAAILLEQVLKDKINQKVVTPISSSKLIEDVANRCQAELIYTRVGSIDVSYKMKETGSLYGCEENGGCFYAPHQPVRDGGMTSLLMLEALAETRKTLSQLVKELPGYYLVKKRVECPDKIKEKVLQELIKSTEDYERILIDGVKVILPRGRVLIRPSGTEPIFRVYAEAPSEGGAEEIAQWGVEQVEQAIKSLK